MGAPTKFGGRTVSDKFEVKNGAPGGPTFTAAPATLAGPSNKKRKAEFGINCSMPHGTTFQEKCADPAEIKSADVALKTPTKTSNVKGHSFEAVGTVMK